MAGTISDILYDPEDTELVASRKWHMSHLGYAIWRGFVDGKKVTLRLHRLINQTPEGMVTDHINGNKLDNRRSNLRTVTTAENNLNVRRKGYSWDKSKGNYIVRFKSKYIGRYKDMSEAREAYLNARGTN